MNQRLLFKNFQRTLLKAVVPLIIAIFAVFVSEKLILHSIFFNELENKSLTELQFSINPIPASKDIIILSVDDDAGQKYSPENPTAPLDRRIYGKLFQQLAMAKASVVLSDIMFVAENPKQDPEFISFIESAISLNTTRFIFTADVGEESYENLNEPDGFDYTFHASPKILGLRPLADVGFALPFDPDEIIIGCLPLKNDAESNELFLHTAALAAWRHLRQDPSRAKIENKFIKTESWEAQLGTNSELPLMWTSKNSDFKTVSILDAIAQLEKGEFELFQNKIVILGDYRNKFDSTTVHNIGVVKGTLALANLINSILAPNSLRPKWIDHNLVMLITAMIATGVGIALQSRKKSFILMSILSPFIFGLVLPWLAAELFRVILFTIFPFISLFMATSLGLISLAFEAPKKDPRLPGELSEATILFSDITSSTALVQKVGAVQYQKMYSEWLDVCELYIRKNGGEIERTTGDGFIAVFPQTPVVSTIRCLQACHQIMNNSKNKDLVATFGFESGPVSGGFLVEAGRKVWSSSGTTVNMAKRLQTLAAHVDKEIVFGPIAARVLKETMQVENLGHHELKGFDEGVDCYCVLSQMS